MFDDFFSLFDMCLSSFYYLLDSKVWPDPMTSQDQCKENFVCYMVLNTQSGFLRKGEGLVV